MAPFRFRQWVKLAMVALLAGAIGGGGGGGTGGFDPSQFPETSKAGEALRHLDGIAIAAMVVGVVLVLLVGLIFTYLSAKFALVFVDGVVRGEVHVGHAWRECHDQGESYFFWKVGLTAASLVALAATVGIPSLLLWRAGRLGPGDPAGVVWLALLVLFAVLPLCIAAGLTSMVAKDFVVPVMYVERCRVLPAWRRVLPLLRDQLKGFALYVLLKFALGLAAAIVGLFLAFASILSVVLVLLVPAGIAVAVVAAIGWTWSPVSIALCAVCGLVVLAAIMLLYACLYLPVAVFFRAYSLLVLGGADPGLATLDPAWGGPVPAPQLPPYLPDTAALSQTAGPETLTANGAHRTPTGDGEVSTPGGETDTDLDTVDLEEFAAPERG
jgi:hypothetical protein